MHINRMSRRYTQVIMYALSMCIGVLGFISIYGIHTLNITNVEWIKLEGGDLAQGYYGWCFFRNSDWLWPIGLMKGVSPERLSIIYIDSVPLFNVIFKLFKDILPQECQFFGVWGIFCFVVSGVIGYRLMYRLTKNSLNSLLGAFFFVYCNIAIQRLYTHTSLAANWLIMYGILVCVEQNEYTFVRNLIRWGNVFFLCVAVNIYYIPILGILLMGNTMYQMLRKDRNLGKSAAIILVSVFSVVITFYVLGGFEGIDLASASPSGLGYYSANLNSLINPMETRTYLSGYGRVFESMPLATNGQYEGYAYLGAGLIILSLFAVAGVLSKNLKTIGGWLKKYRMQSVAIAATLAGSIWLALGTFVSWNENILLYLNYPQFVLKILSIFRSSGRFMWGVWNICAVLALTVVIKIYNKRIGAILLVACICIQLYDFTELLSDRHLRFSEEREAYVCITDNDEWDKLTDGKSEMMLLNHKALNLKTFYDIAELALENNMCINDFYYSRRPAIIIDEVKRNSWNDVVNGDPNRETVYIFDMTEDVRGLLDKMAVYLLDGIWIGVADRVDGMTEVKNVEMIMPKEIPVNESDILIMDDVSRGKYHVEVMASNVQDIALKSETQRIELVRKYDYADTNCYTGTFICENAEDELFLQCNGVIEELKVYKIVE